MPSLTTTDAGLDAMNLLALFGGLLADPASLVISERNGELFIEAVA